MSLSQATVTPTNITLTPMQVVFNSVDLGGTTESVQVSIKYDLADITVDQFGKTPLDKRVSGQIYTVKMTLAEILNKDNWKVAFPSAYEVTSGTKLMNFTDQVGDSLLARAQQLKLHPLDHSSSDATGDYLFYKAVCINAAEVKYGPEKQTGLNVEFVIFPDTSVTPARFMIFGDPTVGVVNASAGSPTFTGTGNGTLTSVTVANGYTKTETITVKCIGIGAASATVFEIYGSLSGPLEVVSLAASNGSTATITSNPFNGTLTQGSSAFVVGDQFTVATTAANYA